MNKKTLKQAVVVATLLLFFMNPVFCQSHIDNEKCHMKQTYPVKTQDCLLWKESFHGKVKYIKETRLQFLMDTLVQLKKEQGLKDRMDSLFVAPRCAVQETFFNPSGNITHKYRIAKDGDTLSINKYFYDQADNLIRIENWENGNRTCINEYSLPLLDKKGNYYINLTRIFSDGKMDTLKLSKDHNFTIVYPDSIQELLKKDSVNLSFELEHAYGARIIKYTISKNQNLKITQETHLYNGQLERTVQTFDCGSNSVRNEVHVNKDKTKLISSRSESKFDTYGNEIEFVFWGGNRLERKTMWEIEYYE